jgi:hypothetical protein
LRRLLLFATVVTLLSLAVASFALDKPNVNAPRNGDSLGPSYGIAGYMPYKAFLVVMTDAVRADTGEVLRSVPGIRHWTNDDGTFSFRCASPRVSIGHRETPLVYRVRCFEMTASGVSGPETVITCRMAQ